MSQRILVVDDDRKTVDILSRYLQREGYSVLPAYDGRQALELARQRQPDLILLDLMLPAVDGLDLCRILRAETKVPIIMVTARTTEDDTLLGLDLGADDYIAKPFSPREVVARVRAVLRRTKEDSSHMNAPLRYGPLEIDSTSHEVRLHGVLVRLTPKEFRLLELLAKHPGRAWSRLELLEAVFGFDYEGLDRTVDVHIMNLRKKIEANPAEPRFLQTVYGVGYKFAEVSNNA